MDMPTITPASNPAQYRPHGMPLIPHPDAWRERKITLPTGVEIHMRPPRHQDLDREGWQVVEERALIAPE
jgi:hypothetical protein